MRPPKSKHGIGLCLDNRILQQAQAIADKARLGGWTVSRADVLRAAINAGMDAVARMDWAPKATP